MNPIYMDLAVYGTCAFFVLVGITVVLAELIELIDEWLRKF